ncbi:MAG TPA: tRNA uridine(34) 5-carboxymethylaminomethyl modification radical SAM/GNAT enzyme Elp3 [Methanotrichaceae archaeon]|nr:tRNA uridine(34) 5-carboxymethylaminomethyl modification radical SAM/GNAT enzyme Elp3 [Methanotrichaceae archaeon]HQJ28713.1 tRNA uridine(34) 5-carboxymethylaminomethyl modification radical SAM/GNAT enzyme Elp3 [Methanotrichaceae archaeon]
MAEDVRKGRIRTQSELEAKKKEAAMLLRLSALPSHADILAAADEPWREDLRLLVRKPTRTLSGVAVIAAMTSPARCPHGTCVPCPGGLTISSPQSYTGREPAAMRAAQHGFDPYRQVSARLSQLEEIGHFVDKAELIIMGGTITARPLGYQHWFVKRCLQAMNEYCGQPQDGEPPWRSLANVACENQQARVKNVGITFETRPDWCGPAAVRQMLSMGATKVELGVQSLDTAVLDKMRRGHGPQQAAQATCLLREAGLKVGYHMMPGLPGSSPETDRRDFLRLFSDPAFRPDYLKIYPTLVVEGTELYSMWKRGEYQPLQDDEAAQLISILKECLPRYVRLQRVQRDIPAQLIQAGVRKSNLRQLAWERLRERGKRCQCIRCREAGLRGVSEGDVRLNEESYQAGGGQEIFISCDSVDDTLVGFLRLRLGEAARVRELHVYGPLVPPGRRGGWQHRGYGSMMLARAQELASDAGYREISVTSGFGVRGYYRDQGYHLKGPYMVRGI